MPDYDYENAAAHADLCRFLAASYYQPGPEFAEEKLFDSMLEAATRIDPDLAQHARALGEHFHSEGIENLLVDYTRLFLGPVNALAQPYESVWLSGEKTLMQDSTVAVLALYSQGGFEIEESFREMPDHIAAELEFLYLLIHGEREARQQNDGRRLSSIMLLRKRFLHEHLARWVGPFVAAIRAGAQSTFYRELANLTERVVGMEASMESA